MKVTFEDWAKSCGLTRNDHYHIYVYSSQAWAAGVKSALEECIRIVEDKVRLVDGIEAVKAILEIER